MSITRRAAAMVLTALVGTSLLTGCGGDSGESGSPLVVWSMENLPDRVRVTERLAAGFTERTGIPVELVAVDENQFSQLVMSSAAAGKLPDVMGALPLTTIWQLAGNELLDAGAVQAVVDRLGTGTFSRRALELTRDRDRQLAVPSDGWTQLLVYRKDLFAAAGLAPPDTYERISRAAAALSRDRLTGISLATAANDAATGQAFEGFAVANGCDLVTADGAIGLDAPPCRETFRFLGELAARYSPPGAQDVDSTRATYFAGRSAMIVWSSFLLDELGGLREDALPACAECVGDPGFLARNSGVVSAIAGTAAEPAQYGELTSWTVPVGGKREEAQRFVQYMMENQAYVDWLGMAPEGKIPARRGDPSDPERFLDAWERLPAGVDTKRPLAEIYPPEVLRALRESPERFRRWGFDQGQGLLMGATLAEMPVPKAVDAMLGGTEPGEAAEEAAEEVRSIQTSLR
ncbi:bicyclomycin resistance protein [Amycolatopsis coloradensis]|uniref:Bicyclomycin resistance protein n=1 Tax=Amycolatopsis coloradensis TaxID=76021 RepID=A0A1R0L3X4_9PSEU|nr:extracellular solute-binding protein [Amycolatopsis coloradensis]OLZ57393.1 bicyclomycin resistance protein [Amycolatopsis coloradensis]